MKKIFIVGGTSDIGRAVMLEFIRNGYYVVATSRSRENADLVANDARIRIQRDSFQFKIFDASRFEDYDLFVGNTLTEHPDIEGLIFVAGVMYSEDAYTSDFQKLNETFMVNTISPIRLIQLFLPAITAHPGGFISVVSSVAGDRGRSSNMTYGASKAAISQYLEGLRQKYSQTSLLVQSVKPGPVATRMTRDMEGLPFLTTPEKVAQDIYNGVTRRKDIVYTPIIWFFIMLVIRCLPTGIFKKLKF